MDKKIIRPGGEVIWRRREKKVAYDYQKNGLYFAQMAESIKEVGAEELDELGAVKIKPAYGGIGFQADKTTLYRINYTTRLASRILAPLISFPCSDDNQLYKRAKQIKWMDFISGHHTFAIFSNVSDSTINNSHYASLRLKDAIADSFLEKFGERPNIDTKNPDIWLNLYIRKDRAVISIDTSGGSLHRRGYRQEAVSAPMQETVAATILRHINWNETAPIYDPMCGSGTLLCEALMQYCNIPSGFLREHFGFEFLPDYDRSMWTELKNDLDRKIREVPVGLISGSDRSSNAVEISRKNLENLPHGDKINLEVINFTKRTKQKKGIIITNPPYGIRMGQNDNMDLFYKSIGDFLKQKCLGSTAYIYFGDRKYIKKIGLKPSWKKPLKAGGLDGRLVKYELY